MVETQTIRKLILQEPAGQPLGLFRLQYLPLDIGIAQVCLTFRSLVEAMPAIPAVSMIETEHDQ